ncbi:MAG: hypothetical protein AAB427_14665 [Chloroflexota bacterium]
MDKTKLAANRTWQVVKIFGGAILWLGLVVLTYYSLLTIPALVLVGLWLYMTVSEYFRQPKPPADDRRDEDPQKHR